MLTLGPIYGKMPFYLNLTVLNKEDVIKAKMVGDNDTSSTWGYLLSLAGSVAAKRVTDDKIAAKVAEGLTQMMPKALEKIGVKARVEQRYVLGAFLVVKVTIEEADLVHMLEKMGQDDKAAKVKTAGKVAAFFGREEKFAERGRAKLEDKMREKMGTKLSEKLEEQTGMKVEVVVKSEEEEAEFMFAMIAHLGLKGAPKLHAAPPQTDHHQEEEAVGPAPL